jgi:hypothetical protein
LSAIFPLALGRVRNTRQLSCEPMLWGASYLVRGRPSVVADGRPNVEAQRVPPALLKRVLPVRDGLPDHPTHVRRAVATHGRKEDSLVLILRHGQLVVRPSDFIDWYERERAKGNWRSQDADVPRLPLNFR